MLKFNPLKNNQGIAIFESIPIILVMIVLLNFSIGFFGVIHTGILNSIASRNYAFETFRHRFDNKYFRDKADSPFHKVGYRFHGVIGENSPADKEEWFATTRPIDFYNLKSSPRIEELGDRNTHNIETQKIEEGARNQNISVNPVWIKTKYGICMNLACGDTQ